MATTGCAETTNHLCSVLTIAEHTRKHPRYNSLKTTFESRLASLADTVRCAVENIHQDQVLQELNASKNTREFAPAHARALIKRHLASERDAFFHGLALRLADAEAEVARCTRQNEELGSSLSVLRGEATREAQSRVEVTSVNADIQELRREYQVRCPFAPALPLRLNFFRCYVQQHAVLAAPTPVVSSTAISTFGRHLRRAELGFGSSCSKYQLPPCRVCTLTPLSSCVSALWFIRTRALHM